MCPDVAGRTRPIADGHAILPILDLKPDLTMQCPKCNSEDLEPPAERRALEIFKCLNCGEELALHCHYPIPDEFRSKHEVFQGRYSVVGENATKDFIKLKNMLRGCQWFQLSKLETQRLDKANVWDLGIF